MAGEGGQSGLFVLLHQPAISCDIGCQNGDKFAREVRPVHPFATYLADANAWSN
jgi:hypothetical protein